MAEIIEKIEGRFLISILRRSLLSQEKAKSFLDGNSLAAVLVFGRESEEHNQHQFRLSKLKSKSYLAG